MVQTKKAAVLFSGGKDSCLALHKILQDKKYDVKYLLSMIPESEDSFMFHKPCLKLLEKQAEMLGIKLVIENTKAEKEKELDDLRKLLEKAKKEGVSELIVGGLASNYQASRIKKICDELDLEFYAPLWNYNAEQLWQELLDNGFEVILTKISCEGIPKEFLGEIIDIEMFEKLKKLSEKYKFRLDFEGGEAETTVLNMPLFKQKIRVEGRIISEGKYRHFFKIEKIK